MIKRSSLLLDVVRLSKHVVVWKKSAVVTGRGGRTVVTRCNEAPGSANSPRIRVTVLSTEVTRLARRFGRGPGSRRSEEKVLGVVNREHKLLTCLGRVSVRECHSLVRHLKLEG